MSLPDDYDVPRGEVHELKTWPQFFQAVWDKRKRAELRKNDRGFQAGDYLHLREWEPADGKYSGREIDAKILHVVEGPAFGLEAGYAMLSIDVYMRKGGYRAVPR